MDSIQVTGIRAFGYIGLLPEEQVLGQWFEVDLTVWFDLVKAGESDRIEDTYDYRSAVLAVQQLIKTERFALIEKLAGAIATLILESGVEQVRVRVTKLAAPIPDFDGKISVDITRRRSTSLPCSTGSSLGI
ncbi:MAG: dihydroneopterin aldolase [Leptolyngbyaceae cyanobacterium SL_5_9]|nr:dihydroneopterin aldolase [Leptolyngbyaceae cyanobacterium SL_5_9]NJO73834.1 dihydroneopterin aldolase [Leptolyngbyaceae cyanobacterium RM1_406_9]